MIQDEQRLRDALLRILRDLTQDDPVEYPYYGSGEWCGCDMDNRYTDKEKQVVDDLMKLIAILTSAPEAGKSYVLGWRYDLQTRLVSDPKEIIGGVVTDVRHDECGNMIAIHVQPGQCLVLRAERDYDNETELNVVMSPGDYQDDFAMGLITQQQHDELQKKRAEEDIAWRRQQYEQLKKEFEP